MKTPNKSRLLFFLPVFMLVLSISGCEKIKEAAEFDLYYNVPQAEVTIDSTILEFTDNETIMLQKSMVISFDSIKRKHDFDKVKSAKFDYIRLEVESPPGANLNWINHLRATISAEGLEETEVGVYNGDNGSKPTIDLELNDISVLPFILKEHITIRIYVRASPPLPAPEVTLNLISRIRITVQPI